MFSAQICPCKQANLFLKSDRLNRQANGKQKHKTRQNQTLPLGRTNRIFGVYPYLTRLQVAKFALAGGNYYRREQNYKLSGSQDNRPRENENKRTLQTDRWNSL